MAKKQAQRPPCPGLVFISFCADINQTTTEGLISVVAEQLQKGVNDIYLLLTTQGGSTMHGIYAYNTLRALPISLTTHNVGSVNSMGNVLFLAGEKRYACRRSSFMFHGVGFDLPAATRFEEKHLKEKLANVENDQRLIADIVADRTNIDTKEARRLFLEAVFLDVDEAHKRGIIHEIRDVQIPQGAPVYQIVFKR